MSGPRESQAPVDHRMLRGDWVRATVGVVNTLVLRGLGSAASVVVAVLAARLLGAHEAAQFIFVFNLVTIAAVCFRWGLDDVVVRRVGGAEGPHRGLDLGAVFLARAHWRVLWWALASVGLVAALAFGVPAGTIPAAWPLVLAAVPASALVALASVAGRVYQAMGRTNLAAFTLNIMVPAGALIGFGVLWLVGRSDRAWTLVVSYIVSALVAYAVLNWIWPPVRPDFQKRGDSAAADVARDFRASRHLGGVVLAQQALNWGAMLLVPLAYTAAEYTAFSVNMRYSSVVAMGMLAVNFTYSVRLAALTAAGERDTARALVRRMALVVGMVSIVGAGVVVGVAPIVHGLAGLADPLTGVLYALAAGQVFFAVSAVFALGLTMAHDEAFLLRVQGALSAVSLVVFAVLTQTTPVGIAVLTFPVAYALLLVVLGLRSRSLMRRR